MGALNEVMDYLWKWLADLFNIKEITPNTSEIIWIIFIIIIGGPLSIVGLLALIQWIINNTEKIKKSFNKIKKIFKK